MTITRNEAQEFTSENTCGRRISFIYRNLPKTEISNKTILDYGGGKYDDAIEYMKRNKSNVFIYDPYNRSDEYNTETLRKISENRGVDIIVCSNVFCVIKEDAVILEALENMKNIVKKNGSIYIGMYEGSKTGIGGATTKGYQRNQKTAEYVPLIKEIFADWDIKITKRIITVKGKNNV